MKQSILLLLGFAVLSCNQKKSTEEPTPETIVAAKSDTIPYAKTDTINFAGEDTWLKVKKLHDGFLQLDYKLKDESNEHHFKMRYFDYSDVIFPEKGVAVTDGKSYETQKYLIYNDTILIMPLLANNNSMSAYIINLKKEKVLSDDLRTSLNFFWMLNKKEPEFITANTPEMTDSTYIYTLGKYKLNNPVLIKNYDIILKDNIQDDLKSEFEIIKKMY